MEVDFIDDFKEDVITTNRQSLNWDHEETKKLRVYLKNLVDFLQADWRKKKKEKRKHELKEKTGINTKDWFKKLPAEYNIKKSVTSIVTKIISDPDLPESTQHETIKKIHALIPEYPQYHWRHLHTEIRNASNTEYKNKDYYRAFEEAVKRYAKKVRQQSSLHELPNNNKEPHERELMDRAFSEEKPILKVVNKKFKKSDGSKFGKNTNNNIQTGQRYLSAGVIAGCRHPIAHEEIKDLKTSGLFTEKDCLDALSLLSHLFSRLDNAQVVNKNKPKTKTKKV